MTKIVFFLILAACTLLLWQCKSTTYTVDSFPEDDYLSFGMGGGFTGLVTTYYLLPNGQLFHSQGMLEDAPKQIHCNIKPRQAKAIFKRYQEQLADIQLMAPGNRYFFMKRNSPNSTHQMQWGSASTTPPEALSTLFTELIDIAKQHTTTK